MKRTIRTVWTVLGGMLLLAACAEQEDIPYTGQEKIALRAWMEQNRPDLLENYQDDGGYYVDVLDLGASDARPIRDTTVWICYTFTGRNLAGDIVLTRNEVEAKQVGSYTPFTHYVPYFKYYAGDRNASLLEGTYLALHNTLRLGASYAAERGYPAEVEMRCGTKVTLYLPSTVVSSSGVGGTGGYEGQGGYELRSGCPFIVTMQITDTVRNPLEAESTEVDRFAYNNGKLKPLPPRTKTLGGRAADDFPNFDPDDPYNDGFAWRNAVDTVPQVYMNLIYKPTTQFVYPRIYSSVYAPYADFAQLEKNICDTLVNRFGAYEGPQQLPQDTVGMNGSVKIWYIGRFLDGFIFDTNIPGVRRLLYGPEEAKGSVLSYTPREAKGLVTAFSYVIPRLRYGQWAALLTTSTYGYGATGVPGRTNTSTSGGEPNYDLLNYYNSMNSYYGAGGYFDPYYQNYYQNYMNGQFSNYNFTTGPTTTTSTTVSTEIPPFAPLLFEFYIEPKED